MIHPPTIPSIRKKEKIKKCYDITLMQTPKINQKKGYKQVFRLNVDAYCHEEAIYEVFRRFNVRDLMPKNSEARYIRTWDILFFDEGLGGKTYYQLLPEGWTEIGRFQIQ
ncbi:hypothetical protein ACOI1C_05645 [Bacillus sp. DJP31]|uniref:hypothetical protein n=1 Tax=Bacillus sp. DJP31 TaxID=3409789 RepID=UPI003BB4956E